MLILVDFLRFKSCSFSKVRVLLDQTNGGMREVLAFRNILSTIMNQVQLGMTTKESLENCLNAGFGGTSATLHVHSKKDGQGEEAYYLDEINLD